MSHGGAVQFVNSLKNLFGRDVEHAAEMFFWTVGSSNGCAGSAVESFVFYNTRWSSKRGKPELLYRCAEDRHHWTPSCRCDMCHSRIVRYNGFAEVDGCCCLGPGERTSKVHDVLSTNAIADIFAELTLLCASEQNNATSPMLPKSSPKLRESLRGPSLRCMACPRGKGNRWQRWIVDDGGEHLTGEEFKPLAIIF